MRMRKTGVAVMNTFPTSVPSARWNTERQISWEGVTGPGDALTDFALRTLEDVPLEELHATFLEAFSDYLVKMDVPLWRFETMARRRGMVPGMSVGAYVDDRLVGFLFNGVRQWEGRRTAYDTGTGVVPAFRKMGATTRMFTRTLEILRHEGVEQYLLEVIKDNDPAGDLYRKQGFETVRGLNCYVAPREALETGPLPEGVTVAKLPMDALGWDRLATFWDFRPSWQNSVDSVMAVPDTLAAVTAMTGGRVVGYGIVEVATGDVPQLAVDPAMRGRGIGRAIIGALLDLTEAENLVALNLEETAEAANAFAEAVGFAPYTAQYEMLLRL
jgi:ribosomal protein S18 acetylase RimI-like enzyme